PEYSALSYAWGEQPLVTRMIFVNGRAFPITLNLYDALHNFRSLYPGTRLWADAICINQSNEIEKGQQVKSMRRIFLQAEETLVWLEVEADASSKAFDFIEESSDRYTNCPRRENSIVIDYKDWGRPQSWKLEEMVALECLLARSWWYRIWVVQEVAVSKIVWVYCGKRKCAWNDVANAAAFLVWHRNDLDHVISQHPQYTHALLSVGPGLDRILCIDVIHAAFDMEMSEADDKDPARSLFQLLSNNCLAKATDPKDKFVALAGLA
ncbi:heterokaryon incompatibility protein-domain-containing protein, partial [Halenospora varia]